MSLQDSVNLSKSLPATEEHVCIGCGMEFTKHPSMICAHCAVGSDYDAALARNNILEDKPLDDHVQYSINHADCNLYSKEGAA